MKHILFIFNLLLCVVVNTDAQNSNLTFKHIGKESGLSQSVVHAISTDSNGLTWVGTQDGLNVYDGSTFSTFYANINDTFSLSNSYIWTINTLNNPHIYIGTNGGGLNIYNKVSHKFKQYYPQPEFEKARGENIIRSINHLNDSISLIGTNNGLFSFNSNSNVFKEISLGTSKTPKPIFTIVDLTDDRSIVGSIDALFVINNNDLNAIKLELKGLLPSGYHDIVVDKNTFYIASGKGLYHVEFDSIHYRIKDHFLPIPSDSSSLLSSFVSGIKLHEDRLWIATNQGLNVLDVENEGSSIFHTLNKEIDYAKKVNSKIIHSIHEVENGIFWIGTQQGIFEFNTNPPSIASLDLSKIKDYRYGTSVHGMIEDQNGRLLLCTDKGLTVITDYKDAKNRIIHSYDKGDIPQMTDDFLVNITKGKNGYWVALRRGGYAHLVFDQNDTLIWQGHKLPAGDFSNIGTNFILETKNDLWIATSGLGLWKKSKLSNEYKQYQKDSLSLSGNYIFHIAQNTDKSLWVSTADGGICHMSDSLTECYINNTKSADGISNNVVLSSLIDHQNRTWVSTSNGLNLIDEKRNVHQFYTKDGLPNNVIYGMIEDHEHNFWASTNEGVAKVTYENRKLDCQIFSKKDGLLYNENNQHAFVKTKDNFLVFGSQNGISYFHPDSLNSYNVAPNIVLKKLLLFGQEVIIDSIYNGRKILTKDINYTDKITLKYNQNFIGFNFSGINYHEQTSNKYQYKLTGLLDSWIDLNDRNIINFQALKPGTYSLEIRCSNVDNLWSTPTVPISIIINPPPWKTWWALLIYALAISAAILGFFQIRISQVRIIEKTKQAERDIYRKRSARDFHDEAGNQLTKIALMVGIVKNRINDTDLNSLLIGLEENTQRLRSSMKDFIWVIDPDNDNLSETLLHFKNYANEFFEYSDITFTTKGIDDRFKSIKIDSHVRRHLVFIFKEAANNCLKYAKASKARFEVNKMDNLISLTFIDDGLGFDVETNEKGHGISNMIERAKRISSSIEINSEKGNGTMIRLEITHMGHM